MCQQRIQKEKLNKGEEGSGNEMSTVWNAKQNKETEEWGDMLAGRAAGIVISLSVLPDSRYASGGAPSWAAVGYSPSLTH